MREHVWFIVSKTDERRFATTRPPSGEWVSALKKDGYKIFRIEFEMPWDWDVVFALPGQVAQIGQRWKKTLLCPEGRHVFVVKEEKIEGGFVRNVGLLGKTENPDARALS